MRYPAQISVAAQAGEKPASRARVIADIGPAFSRNGVEETMLLRTEALARLFDARCCARQMGIAAHLF